MHPAIKLRHIRAFLDIAAEGSLSGVARRQGITQPALSRTLAELEDLLGAPLFRREKRRLILTEAGVTFRRQASLGLQALEAGAAALRPGAGGGAIRVGILPTAATRLFPRVALRFREVAPETVLKIETGPHSHLLGLLHEGRIDLMIGRMPVPAEMAGLTFEHLYEEDIVLVARSEHPLIDVPIPTVLAAVPVILPPEGALIRRAVDDYLASLGLATLRPAFETVALAVGRGILAGSDAVWFISRGVVAEELERSVLVELPTGMRFLSGAVGITRRQAGPEASRLELLVQICREVARRREGPAL
ncbi:Transcriptional regulator [Rubellimicrobium thermophilum DSM 16684]|uniref:Transcriptional regulator n=1 Tax=Rubellimicrobium thermophilum DSM 16684 TaxID=1123069 RepID=S9QU68_9RHOB|nr:LysR substrate-binding domain-containing protein [Rubellimicrobium thermophilum]EPX83183.1 Transcriptional regulator [Rubellimicrobium thermophilum DSM 16684]